MPRVIKHPDIRRAELLDIAANLFAKSGYSVTSVDKIIRQAGLSKGAFYHYFSSEEDLLKGLAKRAATRTQERLEALIAEPGLSAIQRLNGFLSSGRQPEAAPSSAAIFASIFKAENLTLYHRLHTAVAEVIKEPLADIIRAGVQEGTMQSDDPVTTAEIILTLGTITHGAVRDLLTESSAEAREEAIAHFRFRMEQQGIAVDRILGLTDGTWDDNAATRLAADLVPSSVG